MAEPAARPGAAVTVTVTTLLLALQLLLLPAPASSQAALVVRAFPFIKNIGKNIGKQVASAGGAALVKRALGSSNNVNGGDGNLLGAAAADNASLIVYTVSIGPAGQSFSGVLDIFSKFIWVQCPSSPAFSRVPCASKTCQRTLNFTDDSHCSGDCVYQYGSDEYGTNTTGYLAQEAFTVGGGAGTPPIAGSVVFGCSSTLPVDDYPGIIGFSKGPVSILSQLGISRFSYFLTPDDSNSSESTSVVLLGEQAVPQTKRSRSTPLLQSTAYPELYYVKLTGIQVDGEPLTDIPHGAFDLAADGSSGGVVLSTTYPITYLQENAYNALRQALVTKIASKPVNSSGTDDELFDLCYYMHSVAEMTLPKITLVFDGEDSPAMELTTVHYFYKDDTTGLQCLTMLPTDAEGPSVLGSMMQAGTNMIYDLGGRQLTFEKGAATPMPVQVSRMAIASLLFVWVCLF